MLWRVVVCIEDPFGGQVELEGTQKALDELGIKIDIGMF